MPGTFFGINIGLSGLQAAQIGQDVTGHNIANAGTDGYSVQAVDQKTAETWIGADTASAEPSSLGSGVVSRSITRARNQYLDSQVRNGLSEQSAQTTLNDNLKQVEAAYGEPSSHGLNNGLGTFFQNFTNLVSNPEDAGVRATVVAGANQLVSQFHTLQERISGVGKQVSDTISADVDTINDYGKQIAGLNLTIRQSLVQGEPPNDLLDRRDLLVDKLSQIANVNVVNRSDGTASVSIGTSSLVEGVTPSTLSLTGPDSLTARGDLTGGELSGLVQAQTSIAGYQSDLNTLASSLATQVNAIHKTGAGLDGTTGQDFFQFTPGNEADTLKVNPVIANDPGKLAAASVPAGGGAPPAGDSTVAVQLAALQNTTVIGGQTLQGFYQKSVSALGGQSAAAQTATDSAGANVNQLQQQRASVSGVSTDTEMVNMLKYQRAYEASAKVIKTMDDMVNSLITDLGGR